VQQLDPAGRDSFWHLSPGFVMELRSPSGRLKTLRAKMTE
jgi:Uma2 family endonuclease